MTRSHHVRLAVAIGAIGLLVGSAGVAGAARLDGSSTGGKLITVQMTGAAEWPGPGDPDGSGVARLTFNHGRGIVCFELTVADIDPATAAHVHEAPVTAAGPVVIPLAPPTDGSSSGCRTVDKALIKAITKNPSDYYVNVHNATYPPGAVRGQLG